LHSGATSSVVSVTVTKIPTAISCIPSSSEIVEGDTVTISGSISPTVSSKAVTLAFRKPDGTTFTRTVTTASDGSYSDSYKPDAAGSWSVTASWSGDSTHDNASSSSISFTVKSGCLIATATYGSELSPDVQFLREFRDNTVLATFAGSSFMAVFNGFYYSFSPAIASAISSNEVLRGVMKAVLYPLIGILHLSSAAFSLFSFSPELGILVAGSTASSIIGAIYVTPLALLFSLLRKFKPSIKTIRLTGLVWAGSVMAVALAEAATSSLLMMASTGAFVLATMYLTTLAMVRVIVKRCIA
jgi:peptide/nickel transport system substrate-binding protein